MTDNEVLPIHVKDWFQLIHHPGGGELPTPFVRELFLLETHIAGTSYVDGIEEKTREIVPGMVLSFRRDPANRHDDMAIQILNDRKERIGFVPRKDNQVLARLMDAGKSIYGKVREIEDWDNWLHITIKIYMRDL